MFTLWYSILSWKEYREVILGKVSLKPGADTGHAVPGVEPPKQPQAVSKPAPPLPPPKLDPPAKPPRSPSPHPLRTDAFEDIEYEEEESEDEEDDEEDDEDSVVDSGSPQPGQNSDNDFINVEINQQRRDLGPQQRY